jgi:hypothetical protein
MGGTEQTASFSHAGADGGPSLVSVAKRVHSDGDTSIRCNDLAMFIHARRRHTVNTNAAGRALSGSIPAFTARLAPAVDRVRTRVSTPHVFPRRQVRPDALSRGVLFRGPPDRVRVSSIAETPTRSPLADEDKRRRLALALDPAQGPELVAAQGAVPFLTRRTCSTAALYSTWSHQRRSQSSAARSPCRKASRIMVASR